MKKDSRYILLLIILFGFVLRLVDLMIVSAIEMDGIGYALMADNFAKGAFFDGLKGISHPLYPLFLALFSSIINDLEMSGRLLSFALGIGLIPVSYIFFKRFAGEQKALYGSLFVAVQPYLVRYSVQVLSESMATFLFAAAVFFFYIGWTEKDKVRIGLSGLFLALTYLNKAEYIIYALPFCLLLAKDRRYSHMGILLLFIILFSFPYIFYLKIETGLWTITKKVGISESVVSNEIISYSYAAPFESFLQLLHRLPNVAYNFFEAVFPPFFILAIIGFRRVEPSYRKLSIMLVILHVFARVVFAPHSTKRYSVEFIPILIVFAVEGLYVLKGSFERFKHKKFYYSGIFALIIAACIFQGITSPNRGRGFHKEAGIFLLNNDPGRRIISRLPIAPFYAKGQFINLLSVPEGCNEIKNFVKEKDIRYIIEDEKMKNRMKVLEGCLDNLLVLREIGDRSPSDDEEYVKIYRFIDK